MGIRINTNMSSINAQRMMRGTQLALEKSFARLSSGERINKSSDDAAGLAISENLKAQIRGLQQAKRNAMDGISFVQTAEGGLNEVGNILIRLRELAVQASSDTIGPSERGFLNVEFQQLKSEIERIAQSTRFNNTELINGTGGVMDIQIGLYNDDFLDRISFNTKENSATLDSLNLKSANVQDKKVAQGSLGTVDSAIQHVAAVRANFGALQSRLQSTINNLDIFHENISSANSRIRDADIALESAELTRNNILMQSGLSVLAQANQSNAMALKLLQ